MVNDFSEFWQSLLLVLGAQDQWRLGFGSGVFQVSARYQWVVEAQLEAATLRYSAHALHKLLYCLTSVGVLP